MHLSSSGTSEPLLWVSPAPILLLSQHFHTGLLFPATHCLPHWAEGTEGNDHTCFTEYRVSSPDAWLKHTLETP